MTVDSITLQAQDAQLRQAAASIQSGGSSHERQRLMEASREFEALFLKQMLDTMRKTVQKGGLIDGGYAEEIYQDMLYDEYADKMARTARFGLAEMLYNQMSAYL